MPVCSLWIFHIAGHSVSSQLFRVDMFVCVCFMVYAYVHMCMSRIYTCWGRFFPLFPSAPFPQDEVFFLVYAFSYVDGLCAPESNPPVSAFYISYWHISYYRHVATTAPYMGIGDLNSAPCACKRKCSYPNIFVYNCPCCSHCFAEVCKLRN